MKIMLDDDARADVFNEVSQVPKYYWNIFINDLENSFMK